MGRPKKQDMVRDKDMIITAENRPKFPGKAINDTKEQRRLRMTYLFEMISSGASVYDASRMAGISDKIFYRLINKNPEWFAAYEAAKLDQDRLITECVKLCALRAAKDPRYQASLFFYCKARLGWQDGYNTNGVQAAMPSVIFTVATEPEKADG